MSENCTCKEINILIYQGEITEDEYWQRKKLCPKHGPEIELDHSLEENDAHSNEKLDDLGKDAAEVAVADATGGDESPGGRRPSAGRSATQEKQGYQLPGPPTTQPKARLSEKQRLMNKVYKQKQEWIVTARSTKAPTYDERMRYLDWQPEVGEEKGHAHLQITVGFERGCERSAVIARLGYDLERSFSKLEDCQPLLKKQGRAYSDKQRTKAGDHWRVERQGEDLVVWKNGVLQEGEDEPCCADFCRDRPKQKSNF